MINRLWQVRIGTMRSFVLGCVGLCTVNAVQAEGHERPLLHFSGFATLGAVYNDSDDFDFVRDLTQPSGVRGEWSTLPDTILGGQLNIKPEGPFEAVLQAVSSYNSDGNYDPELHWAFLKYQPDPGFSIRLGRIGIDAYLEGDSRNVGYSQLTVRQPIEFFGALEIAYFDGLDAVYKRPFGAGLLSLKVFAGIADERIGNNGSYDLDNSELFGGHLAYQWRDWQVRAGLFEIEFENALDELAPLLSALRASGSAGRSLAGDLALAGSRVVNANVGLYYTGGSLQGRLLYNRRESETRSLADANSVYGLLGYRLSRFTPYVGYVYSDSKSTSVDIGPAFRSVLDPVFRRGLLEQRTWRLGTRYDLAENMALKFQVDLVEAPDPLGGFFHDPSPGWNGHARIYSLTFDTVF